MGTDGAALRARNRCLQIGCDIDFMAGFVAESKLGVRQLYLNQ